MNLRAHLLTAFVVAHVAAITLQALPLPRKAMTPAAFVRSGGRANIEQWCAPLLQVGLLDDAGPVADRLLAWNNTLVAGRGTLLRPFRRYYALTGTGQSWRMFSDIKPTGARLQIHLQRTPASASGEGEALWEPLYMEHSRHRWQARLLNQERVRTVRSYFSKKNGQHREVYTKLSLRLARQAAAEFPDGQTLRVRYQEVHIRTPARIRAAGGLETGDLFWEVTHALAPLR